MQKLFLFAALTVAALFAVESQVSAQCIPGAFLNAGRVRIRGAGLGLGFQAARFNNVGAGRFRESFRGNFVGGGLSSFGGVGGFSSVGVNVNVGSAFLGATASIPASTEFDQFGNIVTLDQFGNVLSVTPTGADFGGIGSFGAGIGSIGGFGGVGDFLGAGRFGNRGLRGGLERGAFINASRGVRGRSALGGLGLAGARFRR